MINLPINPNARRLTEEEKEQFRTWGYIKNLPVFDNPAIPVLQQRFKELAAILPEGVHMSRVNHWHKANRYVYNLCRTPTILDYVEDLLGPNFFQWGAHCFAKFPHDETVVPWHQDSRYWPLEPKMTVSVWLALFDTDETNGAMRIVRSSHLWEPVEHNRIANENYVLHLEADQKAIDQGEVVTLDLKAGEISLHDNRILHGSGPNNSDRIRAGQAMRFAPTNVRCDLSTKGWSTFESYLVRGIDEFNHNPVGKVPSGNGHPVRGGQGSWDFA